MKRTVLALSLVTLTACAQEKNSVPEPVKNAPPAALDAAHDAYLAGDYGTVTDRVRDVLVDHASTPLERQNAYALLDKTFEANKGKVPMRVAVPNGFEFVKFGAVNGTSPSGPFFHVYLYMKTHDFSHVQNLTLRRIADRDGAVDELLLDMTGHVGELKKMSDDGIVLEAAVQALPADGVFAIRYTFDDGTTAEPWFIGSKLASTATPDMKTPTSSESLREHRPAIAWKSFRSPQYSAFENRTMSVYVGYGMGEKKAWDSWKQNYGDLAEVRVENALPAGDYWLSLNAGEDRNFGALKVSRDSRVSMPFHVAE